MPCTKRQHGVFETRMKLINKSNRDRAIPHASGVEILPAGGEMDVSDIQLAELKRFPMVNQWIYQGLLKVEDGAAVEAKKPQTETRSGPELPDGLTGEGTEIYHHGGGWYSVYHAGMACTDEKVRKARAEEIAADYG